MHQLPRVLLGLIGNFGMFNFATFKCKLAQQLLAKTVERSHEQFIQLIDNQFEAFTGITDLMGKLTENLGL